MGDVVFSDLIIYNYHLEIYLFTYCAHSKQLWAIKWILRTPESSHFKKTHTKLLSGRKSHFGRVINWLMALFHHRKWGQRSEIKEAFNSKAKLIASTDKCEDCNFFTVQSNIASWFYASIPYYFFFNHYYFQLLKGPLIYFPLRLICFSSMSFLVRHRVFLNTTFGELLIFALLWMNPFKDWRTNHYH